MYDLRGVRVESRGAGVPFPIVRYHVAASLDGFIAPLDGSTDWLAAASGSAGYDDFIATIGGIIMGRHSFATELSFGPWSYGHIPTIVVSRHIGQDLPGNVEAHRDPIAGLMSLKTRVEHGDIWLHGGGILAGSLLDADLVDRIELTTIPIALGKGRSLFAGSERPKTIRLLERHSDGVTLTNVYAPH